MEFENNVRITLDTVTLYFHTYETEVEDEHTIFHQICIETNSVGGYSMKDGVTHHQPHIWESYRRKYNYGSGISKCQTILTNDEMQNLMTGSKYKRRPIMKPSQYVEDDSASSDSDNPDYVPSDVESDGGSENSDTEITQIEESTVTNVTVASRGQSCINRIFNSLKTIDNKHNWNSHSIDSFPRNYLSSKAAISKLFLYEMDIINSEVKATFGKELFKKNDPKSIRTDKLSKQLKRIPQLFESPAVRKMGNCCNLTHYST